MRLILDSGGVSALAGHRARLAELRDRGHWPPLVPAVVLAESLTGDHRRDIHANRLLQTCQIRIVDERQAREAARLRTATRRAASISAVDSIVAALAGEQAGSIVLTSDADDLAALAAHAAVFVRVVAV